MADSTNTTLPRLTANDLDLEISQVRTVVRYVAGEMGNLDRGGLDAHDRDTLNAMTTITEMLGDRLDVLSRQVEANINALEKALPEAPAAEKPAA